MRYAETENTPKESVRYIVDLIKGKRVFDIGAGNGEFAEEMAKHATVTAIEVDDYYSRQCQLRGLDTRMEDFLNVSFKLADVLFAFLSPSGMYALNEKIKKDDWHGTVISNFHPLLETPLEQIQPDEIIKVELENVMFPFLIYGSI